jgi:uncharacterized protein with beta-barrel porin domain
LVALAAGALMTFCFGWEAFRGWANQIDTTDEAKGFAFDLGGALCGLCVVVTSIHSLVA